MKKSTTNKPAGTRQKAKTPKPDEQETEAEAGKPRQTEPCIIGICASAGGLVAIHDVTIKKRKGTREPR